MNRKDFLYSLCAPVFGAVGLSFLSKAGFAKETVKDAFPGNSINLDSAARIGDVYLKQGGPELKEVQRRADQIQKEFDGVSNGNFQKELQALNFRIRNDYESGKTVLFHNWVLSQTEIAFCVCAYHYKHHIMPS